jgi:HAD superfamily hydrolase (TIGR01509 family)
MEHPALLLDVMSTLVADPIFTVGPRFFGGDVRAMFRRLSREAWFAFERGEIDEAAYFARWIDEAGPPVDPMAFLDAMAEGYAWLPGIEALLADLCAQGQALHVLSNYPPWYATIEARLGLSRYAAWTAVSCRTGLRKPDPAAFLDAAARVGRTADACVFVDDRPENVEAAAAVGMRAVRFTGAAALRADLARLLELVL